MAKQPSSYLVQVAGPTPANGEDKPAAGPVYRCEGGREVYMGLLAKGCLSRSRLNVVGLGLRSQTQCNVSWAAGWSPLLPVIVPPSLTLLDCTVSWQLAPWSCSCRLPVFLALGLNVFVQNIPVLLRPADRRRGGQ